MTDYRKLLSEARDKFASLYENAMQDTDHEQAAWLKATIERIDAALSEPVEPPEVARIHELASRGYPEANIESLYIKDLQSALKLAQEERDEAIKREKSKHEQYSALLERHTKLAEKLEKAESLNQRMVEQYRDLVVAAEKIGGKVTDASNLQISIADVLSMKEALAKLEEA